MMTATIEIKARNVFSGSFGISEIEDLHAFVESALSEDSDVSAYTVRKDRHGVTVELAVDAENAGAYVEQIVADFVEGLDDSCDDESDDESGGSDDSDDDC
jgi:uncharacterized protein YgbK (DUF1537 family)